MSRLTLHKALFLDRDGVINHEIGYLYRIEDFQFIEGVFAVCRYFQSQGYLLFVVTNQAGIARNYYTEADFHQLNTWMLAQFQQAGVTLTQVYYSPFHPAAGIGKYRQESWCRKPNPGMILQAQAEFHVDLARSILVGDKETDITAGVAAGIPLNVLVRSGHAIDSHPTQANAILDSIRDLPQLTQQLRLTSAIASTNFETADFETANFETADFETAQPCSLESAYAESTR